MKCCDWNLNVEGDGLRKFLAQSLHDERLGRRVFQGPDRISTRGRKMASQSLGRESRTRCAEGLGCY